MYPFDLAIEMSRTIRECEKAVSMRIAARQFGSAFEGLDTAEVCKAVENKSSEH